MHLLRGGGTRTPVPRERERLSAMLLSSPGTCLAVKVNLYFKIWRVVRRIRFMTRGILERII